MNTLNIAPDRCNGQFCGRFLTSAGGGRSQILQEALIVSRYSMHEGFRALRSPSRQGHRTWPTVSGGALSALSMRCTTSPDSVLWFSRARSARARASFTLVRRTAMLFRTSGGAEASTSNKRARTDSLSRWRISP